jgi:SAM-dependent methyltransferase
MTADLSPSPYDVFARYYDAFTQQSDYEAWTTSMLELAASHGLAGTAQLDLACGTGKSFLPFLRRGFQVTGCDSSRAMLAEAAAKAPEATLLQADLRELTMLGRFDLVTCFDDSLNYLLDEDELLAGLRGMAANLARHGVALFDLNTLCAYRTTFARDGVTESDGVLFAWRGESSENAAPGCLAAAAIEVFAPAGDGDLYERVTARHEQRHFPVETVAGLLDAAGLECVAVHGVLADGSLVERPDDERHPKTLFIAKQREGGAP